MLAVMISITLSPAVIAQPPLPNLNLEKSKARWWKGERFPVLDSEPIDSLPASSITSAGVEEWSRIVFQAYHDGNWEINLAQGDGSQPIRLTNHPAADMFPRLDRGVTRVAFISDRDGNFEIYVMNADGSSLRRLTANNADDASPVWSPDGSRIAFASKRDGNWEIYVMNADGSAQTRLTYDGADDVTPTWSPDGTRIAWVRRSEYDGALWVMNADGSDAHPITGWLRFLENPDWSPDGIRLAFDYDADGDLWNELAVANADGTGLHTVYDRGYMIDLWMGSWSPDAEWLLFTRVVYAIQNDQLYIRNTYIDRIRSDGTFYDVIRGGGYEAIPDWKSTDNQPPIVRVRRMPRLSHAGGFTVTWAGEDRGPAGIRGYEVQYREGTSGAWTTWLSDTMETAALFPGEPGHTYAFRARAWDNAYNRQPWRGDKADAETTLYTWKVTGFVRDGRGQPIPKLSLTIFPEPLFPAITQMDGSYQAYMQHEGEHTLMITRPGYGSTAPMYLNLTADVVADYVLPPADNVIRNGEFEADDQQLTDWIVSPSTIATPTVTTVLQHTGRMAASLGGTCPYPCLSGPEPVWPGSYVSLPDMAVDSMGNLHVVWLGFGQPGPGQAVYYGYRTVDGTWIGPEVIGNTGDFHWILQPGLAIDGRDTLHVVWSGEAGLYYTQRPLGGDWTPPEVVVRQPNRLADIAADRRGGVHVVYRCASSISCPPGTPWLFYLERTPAGVWRPPYGLDKGGGYMGADVAVGPDGTLHFVFQEVNAGIFHQARSPDGAWMAREKIFDGRGYSYERQRIVVDARGGVHVVWNWPYQVYYAYRPPGGTWSTPVTLPKADGAAELAVDNQGVVHLLTFWSRTSDEQKGTYYRRKAPDAGWTDPVKIGHGMRTIAIDPYGLIHMMTTGDNTLIYQGVRRSEQAGDSAIHQRVTIPRDLHRPTLSVMYQLYGAAPGSSSGFEIRITDELTTTVAFSATTSMPWSLAWADLQPWSGKTVTVTLTAHQAAGDPYVHLFLDEVSLGSWLTPVVQAVSPSSVEAWTSTTVTITGENFIETPAVRLDQTPVEGVRWVDEHSLQVTVPSELPPGLYDVWVMNPGGQENVLPFGLKVGRQVYLPTLFKGYTP